jgi:hypothetical protein
MPIKNILVCCDSPFEIKCGGLTVQYELCKILDNIGINVRIYAPKKIPNNIFIKYYDNEFDLNETLVIYGETISGNPLNAKYVVRWILAPIGICSSIETFKTWSKNDLVYYFNAESKFDIKPELIGKIYKTLTSMYINPLIKNYKNPSRNGYCHTFRKINMHKNLQYIYLQPDSFEITRDHTQEDYVNIFNKKEIFVSYDPLTFLSIIAALCGCISIVVKVEGIETQLDWIKTTYAAEYAKEKKIDKLYGIAYGPEEIYWAKNTLHLVEEQWIDIKDFFKEKTINPFLEDLKNIESLKNTVENNYFVNYN